MILPRETQKMEKMIIGPRSLFPRERITMKKVGLHILSMANSSAF